MGLILIVFLLTEDIKSLREVAVRFLPAGHDDCLISCRKRRNMTSNSLTELKFSPLGFLKDKAEYR
jgi:hypothetical protein